MFNNFASPMISRRWLLKLPFRQMRHQLSPPQQCHNKILWRHRVMCWLIAGRTQPQPNKINRKSINDHRTTTTTTTSMWTITIWQTATVIWISIQPSMDSARNALCTTVRYARKVLRINTQWMFITGLIQVRHSIQFMNNYGGNIHSILATSSPLIYYAAVFTNHFIWFHSNLRWETVQLLALR